MDESTEVKLRLKYKRALVLYDEKCGSVAATEECNHLMHYTEKSDEALVSMKAKKEGGLHESNLTGYILLWMYLPGIALICCCCNGCEHFEGGVKEEDVAEVYE